MQLAGLLDDGLARPSGGRSVGQKLGQAVTATRLERTLEEERDPRGVPQLGAVPRRDRRHRGARADAVRQAPERARRAGGGDRRGAGARPNAKAADVARARLRRAASCSSLDCVGVDGLTEAALRAARRHAARRAARAALRAPRRSTRARRRRCSRARSTRALQRFAVDALRRQLAELAGRNVEDGAVVVLDNASGEVLAWVGSSGDARRARPRSTACWRGASRARR